MDRTPADASGLERPPGGVGVAQGTFLQPGDVIETEIEGIGLMRNTCVSFEKGTEPSRTS